MISLMNNATFERLNLTYEEVYILLSVDWGEVDIDLRTNTFYNQVGLTQPTVKVGGRVVSIKGTVISGSGIDLMRQRKKKLSQFISPFNEYTLFYGDYQIKGVPRMQVVFSNKEKENNECVAYFSLEFLCANPMFNKAESSVVSLSSYDKLFEFPLEIDEANNFIFEEKNTNKRADIINMGDLDSPFVCDVNFTGDVSNFILTNVTTGKFIKVIYDFIANDVLKIKTSIYDKSIVLTRGDYSVDMFAYRDKLSNLDLSLVGNSQNNIIIYNADSGADNMELTFIYDEMFWGCEYIV